MGEAASWPRRREVSLRAGRILVRYVAIVLTVPSRAVRGLAAEAGPLPWAPVLGLQATVGGHSVRQAR